MLKHIIFVFIYVISSTFLSSEMIYVLLGFHCVLNIYSEITKKTLSAIAVYNIYVVLTCAANISLIGSIGVTVKSIYSFIVPVNIPTATLIWCIGNCFIFIGYDLCTSRSFPSVRLDLTNKKKLNFLFIVPLILLLTSISGHELNFSFLGGGATKVLFLLPLIGILIFARLWKKESNKRYMFFAITLCVLQTLLALLSAYRRVAVVYPLMALFAGYFLGLGKLKYIFSYHVIPFLFLFIGFAQLFRSLANNRAHFIDAIYSDKKNNDDSNMDDLPTEDEYKEKGGLLDRSANLAQITCCVKLVNTNGFYKGKASAPLVTALVPRFLWPGKPNIQIGRWFAVEIGQAYVNDEGEANNSIDMTIPGELYLDFGWIGVILGCLGIGILFRMFWNSAHFSASSYNVSGAMWGGYLLLMAIQSIGPDLQIIITLFSTYFSFYVIKVISKNMGTRI